jgi:hypothetical protein
MVIKLQIIKHLDWTIVTTPSSAVGKPAFLGQNEAEKKTYDATRLKICWK